ncbi:MAG: efflux RND transporter periplasmic adaptor subunit [Bacteroidales bacterium]|nr:efflux RND transporter periplasmic adaptor subunit [Bacteroidales bacterium]
MKIKHFILFLPFLLMGCSDTSSEQLKEKLLHAHAEERVIPVGVQVIEEVSGIVSNTYPGYLEEGQSVEMAFKYGGTLQQLNVKQGSSVKKGQTLAHVSSPQMESTRRSAQTTLEQAQDAYDRLKKVHDNGSLPEIKWREMVANLEKAQSALDLANAMLADNIIRAPFDGTIASVNAEIGENIAPMKPIIRLINTKGMAVKISVPENEIAKVQVGDTAEVVIPALGDKRLNGKVIEKSMTASLLTHSYPVKVLIERPDKELSPGMIGKVVLKADVNKGIVVPANAVLINQEGKFVWVDEDGRATRRKITLAGYSGTGVIVSEGLQVGDKVIVEGYQKVSGGMKVEETLLNNGS